MNVQCLTTQIVFFQILFQTIFFVQTSGQIHIGLILSQYCLIFCLFGIDLLLFERRNEPLQTISTIDVGTAQAQSLLSCQFALISLLQILFGLLALRFFLSDF